MAPAPMRGTSALQVDRQRNRDYQQRELAARKRRAIALQQERYEAEQRRLYIQEQAEAREKAIKRQQLTKRASIIAFICLIALLLAVAVAGYATVNATSLRVNKLEKQITSTQHEIESMENAFILATDTKTIKDIAQELGFSAPESYQQMPISVYTVKNTTDATK